MKPFPKSLVDIAENEIRKLIVQGDLALGQRVTESELAQRFGMSKTPVHEALQHLQREGLVQIRPRQGTFVFTFTEEQAESLRQVRILLENFAIQEAVRKNRGRLLLSLGESIKRSLKSLEEGKLLPYHEQDNDFHALFYQYADNPFLSAAHSAVKLKLQVLWRLTLARCFTLDDMKVSIGDHQRLAELILEDKLEEIPAVLYDHSHRVMVFE